MKQHIQPFEYAEHICNALRKGILLTTAANGTVNTMTIGWGSIGIEWNKPIFIAYVRESRYTRELLDQNGEFTVNIPLKEADAKILRYCGSASGRDTNKIQDLNLTLESPEAISVPGIKEFPITLECKVLYQQPQDLNAIPESILQRFYPVEGEGASRDHHIAYYAEIVNSYLIG